MSQTFFPVAKTTDIPLGQVRVFDCQGLSIAIGNVAGLFYAFENTCTHDNGPLADGMLEGSTVECPRHGARFDVRTGEVLRLPAAYPIRTFKTRVENETLLVEVESQ